MKVKFLVLAGLGVTAAGLPQSVQANIVGSTSTTSSWLGSPVYETGPAPTTGNGGTSQDNDSWGGNANGLNGLGALAMTFEVSQAGTLGAAQLVMAGAAQTFNVELYDMGAASTVGYPGSTPGSYVIKQINGLGGANAQIQTTSTTYPYAPDPDLLQSGDQVTYNGVATGQNVLVMNFQGTDAGVSLVPGELYLLSLDPTTNADGTWWVRGGVPSTIDGGEGLCADGSQGVQNFEGKSNPSGLREFDLAVTVPEPASLGLGALASIGLLFRRRRQNV
jgi:hypothetical protein